MLFCGRPCFRPIKRFEQERCFFNLGILHSRQCEAAGTVRQNMLVGFLDSDHDMAKI